MDNPDVTALCTGIDINLLLRDSVIKLFFVSLYCIYFISKKG